MPGTLIETLLKQCQRRTPGHQTWDTPTPGYQTWDPKLPTSDLWWPSLDTCSNLFTWGSTTPSNYYWHPVVKTCTVGMWATRMLSCYYLQRSCESYVFTPVCHSVHRGGVCLSACWDTTPPGRHTPPGTPLPLGKHTPPGSTHPRRNHTQPLPGSTPPPKSTHPGKHTPPGSTPSPRVISIIARPVFIAWCSFALGDWRL